MYQKEDCFEFIHFPGSFIRKDKPEFFMGSHIFYIEWLPDVCSSGLTGWTHGPLTL